MDMKKNDVESTFLILARAIIDDHGTLAAAHDDMVAALESWGPVWEAAA